MKKYLYILLSALVPMSAVAYTLNRVSVHDPSIVWEPVSQTYYIFGSHRASAKTTDMMNWTAFTAPWATATSSDATNSAALAEAIKWSKRGSTSYSVDLGGRRIINIWNKAMNKWCMYLSVNGDNWYSSIVLLTSDNIEGPYLYQDFVVMSGFHSGTSYKDTDLEKAIGTQASLPSRYAVGNKWGNRYPNCIDPCVFYDENGKLWMSYGSWSGGIWMLELDENTGLRDYTIDYPLTGSGDGITIDPYFGKKIAGGFYVSGEASYIEYIGGYYYLFVTYGGLAAGGVPTDYNNGGYQMRVFRSENPDGPFIDSRNNSAVFSSYLLNFGPKENDNNRGENIFGAYTSWGNQAKGNLGERSQGHNSIIAAEDGRTYLVYHTRFQNWGESHQVRVHQVFQSKNGWLVVAPFEYTGEEVKSADIATTQQIATDRIPGKYKLLIHEYKLDHTKKAAAEPVDIELTTDGNITGKYTGTWKVEAGTSYVTLKIGSTYYHGVMVEQTLEPSTTKAPAFTAVAATTGTTAWGYQTESTTGIRSIDNEQFLDEPSGGAERSIDNWYDLQGRKVKSSQRKGIYIRNGKKYIVK